MIGRWDSSERTNGAPVLRLRTSFLLVLLLTPSLLLPGMQYVRRGILPEGTTAVSAPLSWQMYSLTEGKLTHVLLLNDGTSLELDVHEEFARIERRIQYGTHLLEKLCDRYPDAAEVHRGTGRSKSVHRC